MQKTFIISLLFFFFASIDLYSQNQNRPVGASSAAMANSGVVESNIWSVYHNQAGLANLESFSFGLHFDNKYGVKELSHSAIAVAAPTDKGTFGLSLSYFGYSKYNEKKIALAYAKKLFDKVSAGIQLDYFNTSIYGDYGTGGVFTAEIGLLFEPVKNLLIGVHAFNPVRTTYNTFDEEALSTTLKLGVGYYFSEKVLFTVELESDLENTTNFKTAIEYMPMEKLFFRAGINTKPVSYHFGVGYQFYQIITDLAFSHHEILGYSTNISIRYHIISKK